MFHPFDSYIPMAGNVIQFSLKDPLEVNIDRHVLDTIGVVVCLLRSQDSKSSFPDDSNVQCSRHEKNVQNSETSFESSGGFKAPVTNHVSEFGMQPKNHPEHPLDTNFPAYMQPSSIQILGLYLSKLVLRFHLLQPDMNDTEKCFRYWEATADCLTMDVQRLLATEQPFNDTRLDLGLLEVVQFAGTECSRLASLGSPQPVIAEDDDLSVQTFMSKEPDSLRSPWPSTATLLLDLPPPQDSLPYESRERHAFQLRFCSTGVSRNPRESYSQESSANLRFGQTFIDFPLVARSHIANALQQAKSIVFMAEQSSTTDPVSIRKKGHGSRTYWKALIEQGRVNIPPLFDIQTPRAEFMGELSSASGLSFQALLDDTTKLRYSEPAPKVSVDGLSLTQLARLPENVRLRVLLFLSDLGPLEVALGVKYEANTFLRCRAVNKGIVDAVGKQVTIEPIDQKSDTGRARLSGRKERLMRRLVELDEDQLENLLRYHHLAHDGSKDETVRQ